MKLHQLQYFKAVCDQNGITKAAETLHISQPAVSNAIKELEAEFNIKLFKRADKKLILTKEGAYFLLEVEKILNKTDLLVEKMNNLKSKKNVVRLGIPPMISVMIMDVLQDFVTKNPSIKLIIYDKPSIELRTMLRDDKVDVIIVSGLNTDFSNVGSIKLQQTELVFCVHKLHALANEKTISMAHAALEPVVMFKNEFYVREVISTRFQQLGLVPKIFFETQQLSNHLEITKRGLANTFLFKEVIENDPDILGIPLDNPILVSIEMVWNKSGRIYKDINYFINYIQAYILKNKRL